MKITQSHRSTFKDNLLFMYNKDKAQTWLHDGQYDPYSTPTPIFSELKKTP